MDMSFWFDILPDDIIAHIVSEWIGTFNNLQALDIAFCNRNFRVFRYVKCFGDISNIEISVDEVTIRKLIAWQSSRGVMVKCLMMRSTAETFLDLLKAFTQLKRLSLKVFSFHFDRSNDMKRNIDISEIIYSFPSLEALTINQEAGNSVNLLVPSNMLIGKSKIISLEFLQAKFEGIDEHLKWLQDACPNLQEFSVSQCDGITSMQMLPALKHFPALRSITYFNKFSGPAEVETPFRFRYYNRMADRVCTINKAQVMDDILAWDISASNPNHLSQVNNMNVQNIHAIEETMNVLSRCPQLTTLTMNCDTFEHDAHTSLFIAKIIPLWTTSLRELTLQGITALPARIVEEIVSTCRRLQRLIFHVKKCSSATSSSTTLEDAMNALRRYAKEMRCLEFVHMDSLTDKCIDALCNTNDILPKLEDLTIHRCNSLSNRAYRKLFTTYGSQLLKLSLSVKNCDAAWFHLLRSAGYFQKLHTLTFVFSVSSSMNTLREALVGTTAAIFPAVMVLQLHSLYISETDLIQILQFFPALMSVTLHASSITMTVPDDPAKVIGQKYSLSSTEAIQRFIQSHDITPYIEKEEPRSVSFQSTEEDDE